MDTSSDLSLPEYPDKPSSLTRLRRSSKVQSSYEPDLPQPFQPRTGRVPPLHWRSEPPSPLIRSVRESPRKLWVRDAGARLLLAWHDRVLLSDLGLAGLQMRRTVGRRIRNSAAMMITPQGTPDF
jgi:hypothetical protein